MGGQNATEGKDHRDMVEIVDSWRTQERGRNSIYTK